jgi:hypothetical protein
MTERLQELANLLAAATAALQRRLHVWREVIDEESTVIDVVYRGSVLAPADEPTTEPSQTENRR